MRALNLRALALASVCVLSACDPIQTGLIDLQVVTHDASGTEQPAVGARCTLETDVTLETDTEGRVQFAGAAAGSHSVRCLLDTAAAPLSGVVEVEVPLEAGHPGWVEASLTLVPTDAPLEVEVWLQPRRVRVSWSPPVNSGGAPILGYRLRTLPEGPELELDPATTEVMLTELALGSVYSVEVAARTLFGVGPAAVSENFTFATVPSSPLNVDAVADSDAALVFWSAPDSDGGAPIIAFHVISKPGELRLAAEPDAKTLRFTGLEPGVTYSFRVIAENAIGEGAPSPPSPEITLPMAEPIGPPAADASHPVSAPEG